MVEIQLTGSNNPAAIAQVMSVLAAHGATLLKVAHLALREQFSWLLAVELDEQIDPNALRQTLELQVADTRVHLSSRTTDADGERGGETHLQNESHVLTVMALTLTAADFSAVVTALDEDGFQICAVKTLSRPALQSPGAAKVSAVELMLAGNPEQTDALRARLTRLHTLQPLDYGLQPLSRYRKQRRLVCFDMDSTLIQTEVINELAKAAGVGEKVAVITEKAMRGELDFAQSFRHRLALLKGLPESVLQQIAVKLPLTDGVITLMQTLKAQGYKTAILSGGFSYFAEHLQERLGMDYVFANRLAIKDGVLTGETQGEIVDGQVKARLLRELAAAEGLGLAQTVAVGDGANDLPMLHAAGLGIAFHAKPLVREQAKLCINRLGLDAVLYLLGFEDQEILF